MGCEWLVITLKITIHWFLGFKVSHISWYWHMFWNSMDQVAKRIGCPLRFEIVPAIKLSPSPWDHSPKDDYTLYGDYAFGHFLMCFDSVKGFTKECQEAQCHMDPGAYGTSAGGWGFWNPIPFQKIALNFKTCYQFCCHNLQISATPG